MLFRSSINTKQIQVWTGVQEKTEEQEKTGVQEKTEGLQGLHMTTLQAKEGDITHNNNKTEKNHKLAGLAGVNEIPNVCEKNIIEKCYKSEKNIVKKEYIDRDNDLPLQGEKVYKRKPKVYKRKPSNDYENLSDKQDKSAKMKKVWDILKTLDVVPGEKGRIDAEQLLLIFNHEGFTTTETLEAIEEAGGILTEPLGKDALYDFTSSLAAKGGD